MTNNIPLKGYFAHRIYFHGNILDKHILFVDTNGKFVSVEPYHTEKANTGFYNGLLIAVSDAFIPFTEEFILEMKAIIHNTKSLPLPEVIEFSEVCRRFPPNPQSECILIHFPDMYGDNIFSTMSIIRTRIL